MAITRVKTWAAEILTFNDLNAEFDNILNNALSLISPLTGNLAAGSNDITGLDELALDDAVATSSAVGRLRRNGNAIHWHDQTGGVALQTIVGGHLFGLTLSNNGVDATNDIDIAVGTAVDSTEALTMRLTSALTKQLDAVWAVGTNAGMLDTGAVANTTYHIFVITRVDTGVVDILASTSATAPSMPASYTLFRRIGSILRVAGAIVLFTQDGDYFRRSTSILDVSAANPGTAAVTRTLSVPIGINIYAMFNGGTANSGAAGNAVYYFSDLASTDAAVSLTVAPLGQGPLVQTAANAVGFAFGTFSIRTNTSAQIRSRLLFSDASVTLYMATLGWIDRRNQDA